MNFLVDIRDRKRAEEFVQRLASIVEFSEDAIVSKNLDGVITSWNSSAERLFGHKVDEVVGKPITILIPLDRLERIGRGERIDHYETRMPKVGS